MLISAALKATSRPAVAVHIAARRCTLLKSAATELELRQVLARRRIAALVPEGSRAWMDRLLGLAEAVSIKETIHACRDPEDDKFLELAVNGRAALIISGDADLLELGMFRGVPILTPAQFLERMEA